MRQCDTKRLLLPNCIPCFFVFMRLCFTLFVKRCVGQCLIKNYLLTYVEADNFTVQRYIFQYLGDCGLAVWSRLAKLLYVETGQWRDGQLSRCATMRRPRSTRLGHPSVDRRKEYWSAKVTVWLVGLASHWSRTEWYIYLRAKRPNIGRLATPYYTAR